MAKRQAPNPAAASPTPPAPPPPLVENVDYYIETGGRWVFTETYHRRRGHCCESGCRHCPYGFTPKRRE